jgi:transcriptional repressor NrdR
MRCPQCGERETRVVDSRDLDDSATIRRRRECAACSMRFTTYERVEAARLVVIKRDGARQEFDRERLVSGLRKALTRRPVPAGAAEAAADAIEAELRAAGVTEVPSSQIGALAMEQLRGIDQIA